MAIKYLIRIAYYLLLDLINFLIRKKDNRFEIIDKDCLLHILI